MGFLEVPPSRRCCKLTASVRYPTEAVRHSAHVYGSITSVNAMNAKPGEPGASAGESAPLSADNTIKVSTNASGLGAHERLSPWWWRTAVLVMALGFAVLIALTARVYTDAPPIPAKVVTSNGQMVLSGDDIRNGQLVFLKHALMNNGSIWGHGALLGPDFSAAYLHSLALHMGEVAAQNKHGLSIADLSGPDRAAIQAGVRLELKRNRYDPITQHLQVDPAFQSWFALQSAEWVHYFSDPAISRGMTRNAVSDPTELRQLSAFVAWTAWASAANRPGESYSYTNNFPYDELAGNTHSTDALLWSALSLIFLLVGTAAVLLAFGKWDYLGWKARPDYLPPPVLGSITPAQRATLKYFVVVLLLLFAQTLVGSALAHYRAEPGDFYGFDLAAWLPSNLLRTWHVQLALFWIATAYVAGALFLASTLGGGDPKRQVFGVNALFCALLVVVVGSLLGEWAGIRQLLPELWFWFGHQGWEYLELGRAWQILLAAALLFWFWLLVRALRPALADPEKREIARLFLCAALAIPVFYLPAMFFDGSTHFSIVDTWRFWIIHLWVEGFFEFFVTVMVAIILLQFGVVSRLTATRVIYLDAILYFGGGFIGTGHHWYWSGQGTANMALSALFSALEVVPLTLITLDAWDFVRLSQKGGTKAIASIIEPVESTALGSRDQPPILQTEMNGEPKNKWTFYFLMSVGFWNFLGAGVFGFLINLPIVSYYETGTLLTINHGHAAMMGVFGMLGIGLIVFAIRQSVNDVLWRSLEKYVRVSFWGLNIGLALMVFTSLFPAGVLQLIDVLDHGYWHARSLAFVDSDLAKKLEWASVPGHVVLMLFGVLPMTIAAMRAYLSGRVAIQTSQSAAST